MYYMQHYFDCPLTDVTRYYKIFTKHYLQYQTATVHSTLLKVQTQIHTLITQQTNTQSIEQ